MFKHVIFKEGEVAPTGTATHSAAPSAPLAPNTPPPAAPAAPQQGAQPQQQQGSRQSGNVILPANAMKRIKEENRAKGKAEAMGEVENKFKAAGFASIEDALGLLVGLKNGGQPAAQPAAQQNRSGQPPRPGSGKGQGTDVTLQRERDRLAKAAEDSTRELQREKKRNRDLTRKLDAAQAETNLRETAWKLGIKDTDYAIRLLTRHLETLGADVDPTKAENFDEGKFFEGLKPTHPYLFGETTRPATTGTGAEQPPAPKPGAVAQGAANGSQVDARKMNPQEYREHVAKRGLQLPSM